MGDAKLHKLHEVDNRRPYRCSPQLLAFAMKEDLTDCIIIGLRPDGTYYSDVNFTDGPMGLWLLEQARADILRAGRIL